MPPAEHTEKEGSSFYRITTTTVNHEERKNVIAALRAATVRTRPRLKALYKLHYETRFLPQHPKQRPKERGELNLNPNNSY